LRLQFFCAVMIGGLQIASAQTSAQGPDPHSLILVGDRFKPLKYDQMTPEQKSMIDHLLAGERHGANGPFNVLLRSPEVGHLGEQFGGAMRFRTPLPKDVSEMIILMTGRYWMAQYEWNAHKAAALRTGVSPAIVDAIAAGTRPANLSPEMELAYEFIAELLTTHQVSDEAFKAVKDKYEERGVVDMLGLSGWYGLVSMLLNVDRYPLPEGAKPALKPLAQPLPILHRLNQEDAGSGATGFDRPVPGALSPAEVKSSAKGHEFTMLGDRFQPLTYEQMTPEQKKMTDLAVSQRGTGGSFNISLRDPDGGQLFFDMGERVRFHMSVPDKLKELTILLAGRYWGAQYEWVVHHRAAVRAGLSEDKVKAIAEGRRPLGMTADEEAVYNFITELFKTKYVRDAPFAALKDSVGERGLVDLIVTAGYYQVVSMFMNTDRLPVNANQQAELKYLADPLP
jgi:4-carboxymuconolactone decarboxylase